MLSEGLKQYVKKLEKLPYLNWDAKFVELHEWSKSYQQSFKDACKAIEHNSTEKLKDSIKNMEKYATDKTKYLDVCCVQSCISSSLRKDTFYYMTLLSHAAVHGRKVMVEELISNGANTDSGNGISGIPLTQMLVYAQHHNCPEKIDGEIVQLLINARRLNISVIYRLNETVQPKAETKPGSSSCSPVELALKIKKFDIAKQMVIAGANPIDPNPDEHQSIPTLLEEYYYFGTNKFISWLLNQHLLSHNLPKFIEDVMKIDMYNASGIQMFNSVGRDPTHALLTCGNEYFIREFLESKKCRHKKGWDSDRLPDKKEPCYECLTVKDANDRTALQIAAQNDDSESVAALLKFYRNEDRQDKALALLGAARRGNVKIVRLFLKEDISVRLQKLSGCSVLDHAVKEGLNCLFEVLHSFSHTHEMLNTWDRDGNSLVHVASLTGNSRLFKAFFPLQEMMHSQMSSIKAVGQDLKKKIIIGHAKTIFEALTLTNRGNKTPLQLAIENDQLCILRTLQDRIVVRDSLPGARQSTEKNAWKVFWTEWSPKLFIYACSHGSVDAVKFFIEMESPQYYAAKSAPALCAAAKRGKDDTLQYLLSECKYSIPKLPEHSPLLLAAKKGHAVCVSILLKHGADVKQKSEDKHNCLMIAIKRKFKSTAMAILSDKQGFEALRCRKESVTPMRMLIEHLPDVAEWVLNKCVLAAVYISDSVDGTEPEDDSDEPPAGSLLHAFEFFEAFRSKNGHDETDSGEAAGHDWQQKCCSSNDIILLMIKHKRKNLLDHFLVERLISFKWRKVGLPFLITSYVFHLLFLVLLTAFALSIPRPGPTCPVVEMAPGSSITENMTGEWLDTATEPGNDNKENDPDIRSCEGETVFLTTSAAIIIIASTFYLVVKVYQLYWRKPRPQFRDITGLKYVYEETLDYLHQHHRAILNDMHSIALYLCVIIFVFPVGHECWCFPSWKWQIGALAIFMAWINNFILLKDIPHFGIPITRLFNVYLNFILLIYLPILLIMTFAFPFYMLFIATLEGTMVDHYFPTSLHAIWDVLLQSAGGPDSQFFSASLSHKIMTYLLFITFIVAVPVLFSNFLIGEAVGEADAERKKAKLSIIQSKVRYIQECEQTVPFFRKYSYKSDPPALETDQQFRELLEQQNRDFLEEFELEGDTQKKKLEKLQANIGVLEAKLNSVEKMLQSRLPLLKN